MPRPVSRDSLARSQTPSDLYDTIRRPTALNGNRSVEPKSFLGEDKLISEQTKLNTQVLNNFKKIVPSERQIMYLIAQLSKYAFLAVVLPPYLIVCDLPRWFFYSIMPQMFEFFKDQAALVGTMLANVSKWAFSPMRAYIQETIGENVRMLFQFMRSPFMQLFEWVAAFKALLTSNFHRPGLWFGTHLDGFIDSLPIWKNYVASWFTRIFNWLKATFAPIFQYIGSAIKACWQAVYHPVRDYIVLPVVRWLTPPIQAVIRKTIQLKNALVAYYRRTKAYVKERCLRGYQAVMTPLTAWIKRIVTPVKEFANKTSEAIKQKVQNIFNAYLKPAFSAVCRPFLWFADKCKQGFQRLKTIQLPKVKKPTLPTLPKFKNPFSGFGSRCKLLASNMGGFLKKGIQKILSPLLMGTSAIRNFFRWIGSIRWKTILQFLQKGLAQLKRFFVFLGKVRRGFVLGVRVAFAWVWVLSHYSMESVRQTAANLRQYLRS